MVETGNGLPEDDSEFVEAGLTPIPSVKIAPPRVAEAPIHFECKVERMIELGASRHTLVIGEVVYVHVDPAVMTGKYNDMRKLQPLGRLNGFFYTALGEILERKFEDKR
jgi:flavin reductase (DIM6/NTAB) family NADH-FMN oxidoreductase RutF